MKPTMWLIAVLYLGVSEVVRASTGLSLLMHPHLYTGHVYSAPPSAGSDYVVFSGEAFPLQVEITNKSPEDRVLPLDGAGASRLFTFRLAREGVTVPADVAVGPGRYVFGFAAAPIEDQVSQHTISSGGYLQWDLVLNTRQLRPGRHTLEVATQAREDSGRPVSRHATRVRLDVRATQEGDAEVYRRRAMRAVDRNDIPVARTAIAALLAVHPGSYAAFEMLADIADREGQRAEANAMAQQAADQLSSGRDVMFARWADQRMVQQAANALALRARRPR